MKHKASERQNESGLQDRRKTPSAAEQALLLAALLVLAVGAYVNLPLFSPSKIEALKAGMTKAQVETILGKPAQVGGNGTGDEIWYYNPRKLSWSVLAVKFDYTGHFVCHYID